MRRLIGCVVTGIACLALSVQDAPASGAELRPLLTADDTRGWEGVGRLNIGDGGYCTGALIAEDLVLTAAHCLYDKTTGARIDAREIEFLAGWRGGRASAYRSVRRAVAHPEFTMGAADNMARVANDLALLQLVRPIRNTRVTPFETKNRPRKGAEVGVVSYARDRSEAPSLQEACRVLARQGGILVVSCDVDQGASGSPIFVMTDEGPRIVSVVSAKAELRGRNVALGTSLEKPLAKLRELIAADAPVAAPPVVAAQTPVPSIMGRSATETGPRTVSGTTDDLPGRPVVRSFGTASSGAKFVRPEG